MSIRGILELIVFICSILGFILMVSGLTYDQFKKWMLEMSAMKEKIGELEIGYKEINHIKESIERIDEKQDKQFYRTEEKLDSLHGSIDSLRDLMIGKKLEERT